MKLNHVKIQKFAVAPKSPPRASFGVYMGGFDAEKKQEAFEASAPNDLKRSNKAKTNQCQHF